MGFFDVLYRRMKLFLFTFSIRHRIFSLFCICFVLLFFFLRTIYPPESVMDDPIFDLVDLKDDRIQNIWKEEEFECLGFYATHGCDPNGQRDYSMDVGCSDKIPRNTAGYCAIRNKTSGEIFHLMKSTCKSWMHWKIPHLNCTIAKEFSNFPFKQEKYQHFPSLQVSNTTTTTTNKKRGIIMIGYPRAMPGVYAIIRILRILGCTLPIELWIDLKETSIIHSIVYHLEQKDMVIVREMDDPEMKGFYSKIYAIYHSKFDQVLFLDSDNIPAKDPTYLFDSKEFQQHGTIFWPDFWSPLNTPFNIHKQSALWNLMNVSYIENMFEQESGQLLIDRQKAHKALNRVMFYSQKPFWPDYLALVYGDKDLFRLAWASTKTPFHFIQHLLIIGGKLPWNNFFFCGTAMIQRDPQGEILFLHRNGEKLNGRSDQELLMTHLQVFTGGQGTSNENILDFYRVHCTSGIYRDFCCHRFHDVHPSRRHALIPMQMYSIENSTWNFLEKKAIEFSIEGRKLLTKLEEKTLWKYEQEENEKKSKETQKIKQKRFKQKQMEKILLSLGICMLVFCFWYGFFTYIISFQVFKIKIFSIISEIKAKAKATSTSTSSSNSSHHHHTPRRKSDHIL